MDLETADLLFGLALAQLGTVQSGDAGVPIVAQNLTNAFDFYVESGDADRAVEIATLYHSANLVRARRGT